MNYSQFLDNFNWTEEQEEVLNSTNNTLITGVAGSGKTILAIRKSFDLTNQGYTVAIIVFTKALNSYISDTINSVLDLNSVIINYEYEWGNNNRIYDYIIIDEFQDFSLVTLQNFEKRAKKGIFYFGDLEQQLYEKDLKNNLETIKKSELSSLKVEKIIALKSNFRIPNSIVQLIKQYQIRGHINSKSLKPSNINNTNLPKIKKFSCHQDEMNFIVEIIKKYSSQYSIGILVNRNKHSGSYYSGAGSLFDKNIEEIPSIIEIKYFIEKNTGKEIGFKDKSNNTLRFKPKESINILTVHSSKGLEFDIVILPFYRISNSIGHLNSFYVAATRCKVELFITYSGVMQWGFKNIKPWLYDGTVTSSENE